MTEIDFDALLTDPRAEAGRTPVSGEDLRGGPEFEAIEHEFRKIETAGPAAVDWKMINNATLDLLKSRSKDLVLATRLVYGLHREEDYKGLAIGITILNDMVRDHWDGMFPPPNRERGRAGSFDWIAEKLAPVVENAPPTGDKLTFALIAHDRLSNLDTALSEKMTKFPVALGPLIRALRPFAREARQALEAAAKPPEPAPAPAPAVAAPAATASQPTAPLVAPPAAAPVQAPVAPPQMVVPAPAPAPAAAAAPVPELVLGDDTQRAYQSLYNAALRLAGTARQQSPADPRAYSAARFALWSPINAAPPDQGGKTALPAPQRSKIQEIQALRAASNHQGLLLSAESGFATSPFWLDAHHIAYEAMGALGPDYAAARQVITGELAAFLLRIPSLPSLAFSDGTPFAEAETLAWIAREVQVGGGGESDGGDSAMGSAVKLAQAGQMLNGLRLMMDHADSRRDERERFVARLEVGEFCLRFELLQPLIALTDGLGQQVEQQSLDRWEPKLAARLAGLGWRMVTHRNAKKFLDERDIIGRKSRILGQLAQLDIVMAAELSQA